MSEGQQSANGLPGPDTECRSCLWGERGPGGGARQLGRAASVPSGFVISGAYPVWSDPSTTPGPLSTTGSVQTGNLARYICHKNVTSLSTSSRCKLSIVYWINIGPYFGFQSCSYYQYLMMLVTQDNRWHAGYPGGRTNAVLKGDRGLFCIWWRDFTDICKFSSFSHGQWPGQTGDWVQGRILSSSKDWVKKFQSLVVFTIGENDDKRRQTTATFMLNP